MPEGKGSIPKEEYDRLSKDIEAEAGHIIQDISEGEMTDGQEVDAKFTNLKTYLDICLEPYANDRAKLEIINKFAIAKILSLIEFQMVGSKEELVEIAKRVKDPEEFMKIALEGSKVLFKHLLGQIDEFGINTEDGKKQYRSVVTSAMIDFATFIAELSKRVYGKGTMALIAKKLRDELLAELESKDGNTSGTV